MQQVSLMLIITLITQAISMYKSAITASNFGACVELDAYNFANNLSTFFLTFVSTVIAGMISLCGITLRMKKKYGFATGIGNCVKEILKTECALMLSIIIVLSIKTFVSLTNDIIIFLIFGLLSVIVFGAFLLLLQSKAFKFEN